MTSHSLGPCCFQGVKHEGEVHGRFETIGDFEAYVTEPASPNGCGILYLTDIVGYKFNNAKLVADQYAANGYLVVMPDLFYGDPVPLNADMATFNLPNWMQGQLGAKKIPHTPQTVDPIVEQSLQTLRDKYKCKTIAVAGYCFGAKYAVRALASSNIDAVFIAHPAMISKEELENIKGPLAIAAAEIDAIFPASERHESEETLKKLGTPFQINLYSGVHHGFAVRCDLSDRVQRLAKESAFLLALQWFEAYALKK
ncbi:esterase/lipase [Ilyonectria destructans]|nr:esterase/lipase [Ilyonectria destructans]